ncbi:MAG: hemerythrin domain-containing protein [Dermatophilaceae bacterium]
MCEYCGCQEIAVIADLTREHDEVVALISEVQRSIADQRREDVAASCQKISAILVPHTVVEEQGLFPEMAAEFPAHIEVLRSEHREIEKVLDEATGGGPDDPTWPERLSGALHLLREHILKEQDGVFPAALVALDPEQWERIEAVRARLGSASPPLASATTTAPH